MLTRYLFNVPKKFKILGCMFTTQKSNTPLETEKVKDSKFLNLIVNLPIYYSLTRYLNSDPGQYSVVGLMHNKGNKDYPYTMEISENNKSIGFLRFIQIQEPSYLC